jgi:hypothetical protein
MRFAAFQQKFREFKQNEQLKKTAFESKWKDVLTDKKLLQQKGSVGRVRANYIKQRQILSIITRLLHCLVNGESKYQFSLSVYKHNLELLNKHAFA